MTDIASAPLLQLCINFALSMGVGIAVGTERAINNRETDKKTSMRDFALVAILAYVSSLIYSQTQIAWLISFVTVIAFALIMFVLENMRSPKELAGMTTLLALPITFVLASLPNFSAHFWVIASIVFVLLLVLDLKEQIHQFINGLERQEVFDFAILIGIAVSLTPLIPADSKLYIPLIDAAADGWQISYRSIGLQSLWKVVIMVSLMSFVAHFITKYTKGRKALVLAAFFGGLVSSLATILMLLRNSARNGNGDSSDSGGNGAEEQNGNGNGAALSGREIFLGFVAANTGSIVKDVVAFRMVVGEEAFTKFLFPTTAAIILFVSITAYAFSVQEKSQAINITSRPLPLNFIFKFSGILVVLIVLMTMTTYYLGNGAIVLASFLSSMISSAAAVTSIGAAMVQEGGISGWVAGLSILAAFMGSIGAKYIVIVRRLGLRPSLPFMLPIAGLGLVTWGTMWIAFTQ